MVLGFSHEAIRVTLGVPTMDSSFELVSFGAIAYFCPTHPRLYIASLPLQVCAA